MQVFAMQGWSPINPGWRWLDQPQSISDRASGVGASTPRGAVSSSQLYMYVSIFDPSRGPYPPRVWQNLRVTSDSQPSVSRVRVATACGEGSTQGGTVFVPGLSEL